MLVLGWCLLGDGGGDLAVELLEAPHPGVGGHVLHPPAVQYSTVQYSTVQFSAPPTTLPSTRGPPSPSTDSAQTRA